MFIFDYLNPAFWFHVMLQLFDSGAVYVVQGRWTTCRRHSEHCVMPVRRSPTRLWRLQCVVRRAAPCWLACTSTTTSPIPTTTTARHCSGVRHTSHAASAPTFTPPDIELVSQFSVLSKLYVYSPVTATANPSGW